jgi:hypothetical protein
VGLTPYTSPIDLAIAGAPGCRLYHAPLALVGQVTDAAGAISILAAAPMSASAVGTSVYVQFAPSDRQANAMGMTVSDFGRVLFGY